MTTDLRERFRAADGLPVDDIWDEVEARTQPSVTKLRASEPREPRRWIRILTIAAALVIGLASVALLLPALRDRTKPAAPDGLWAPHDVQGWIAYSSDGNVDVADPAAAVPRDTARVLFHPPTGVMWPLSWSPDGSALLVSWASDDLVNPGGTADLYLLHDDGSLTRLTTGAPVPALGSFAPDGTILFATDADGIGRLDPVTGSVTSIVAPASASERLAWPTQSDDGRIAFLQVTDGKDVALDTASADGSHRRTLVDSLPAVKDVSGVAWSPDGRRVAFGLLGMDNAEPVYVVNADGTGLHKVIDGAFPSWSPDGSRLVVEKQGGLVTLRPDGSDLRDAGIELAGGGWAARVGPWDVSVG